MNVLEFLTVDYRVGGVLVCKGEKESTYNVSLLLVSFLLDCCKRWE